MFDKTITFENYVSKTFARVAIGLLISAATSFLLIMGLYYTSFLYRSFSIIVMVSCFAELGLAIFFGARLQKMSTQTAWICYILYSVLTGISLTSIVLAYGGATCFMAFAYTAVMFVCMAIIGTKTNLDILSMGGLFSTGLITCIIVSIINALFIHSSGLELIISYVEIIVFLALVAYDTRKLQNYYEYNNYNTDAYEKASIYGAFNLYLDFINLFLRLLELFGRNRKNRD